MVVLYRQPRTRRLPLTPRVGLDGVFVEALMETYQSGHGTRYKPIINVELHGSTR